MDQFKSSFSFQELANQAARRKEHQSMPSPKQMTEKSWRAQLDSTAHYLLSLTESKKIWQLERFRQDMKHFPNHILDQIYHILLQHMLDYEREDMPQKDKADPLYHSYLELFKRTRMIKLARLRTRSQVNQHQLNLSKHYSKNYQQS